jgi:uncharacterized protein (TIGR03382 family)
MKRANPVYACLTAALMALAGLAATAPAGAVTVTLDAAALDAVYSQPSFGADPVEVRVAPVRTVRSPDMTRVVDAVMEAAIFDLAATLSPGIGLVFVDSIEWCSGYETEVVGCALRSAPGLFVESDFAAGPYAAEMLAHEIAHNLGLDHRDGGLMNPMLNGDTSLTRAETATILSSPLVGSDAGGRFIDLIPIRIAPIPLPATAPLLALGALALVFARRRV